MSLNYVVNTVKCRTSSAKLNVKLPLQRNDYVNNPIDIVNRIISLIEYPFTEADDVSLFLILLTYSVSVMYNLLSLLTLSEYTP